MCTLRKPVLIAVMGMAALLLAARGRREEFRTPEQLPEEAEPLGIPMEETEGWEFRLASNIIGLPVLDWDTREVGRVEDLAIELGSGLVRYVVFRFDRLPGVSADSVYPVPLRFLQFDPQRIAFLANVDQRSVLENAPTLEHLREQVPGQHLWDVGFRSYWTSAMTRLSTEEQLSTFTERPFYWNTGTRLLPGSTLLFTDLQGQEVSSAKTGELGRMEDLAFDLRDGQAHFAVIKPAAGIGGARVPLPLSLLTLDTVERSLAAGVGADELRRAPRLPARESPGWGGEEFRNRMRTYWNEAMPSAALRAGMRVLPGMTMRASLIIGHGVSNLRGVPLGDIQDLVIERSGEVPYAVVEFGDVLGFGGRWYCLPMGALTLDRIGRMAIVDLEPGVLEQMKGSPKGELPDTSSPDWDREIRAFWRAHAAPGSETAAAAVAAREQVRERVRVDRPGAMLVSGVLDYTVTNPLGEDLGRVDDLMIDLESTRLAYPIVSVGGIMGFGAKRFPVPPEKMTVDTSREALVLDVDPELFEQAPGYTEGEWPDTADRFWSRTVDEYWGGS